MKTLLYISILILTTLRLTAQDVHVSATIDTNVILIGEQTEIELTINYRRDEGDVKIEFPLLYDTISELVEIVSKSKIDTLMPDKEDPYLSQQTQRISISSFDSGYYVIKPFVFIVNSDSISTEALLIEVQNMAVDTAKAIFDVKPPLEEPFSIIDWVKENWQWITAILVGILALVLLIVYLVKRPQKEKVIIETPTIPAYVIALEKLEKIKADKLWQTGKVKKYHSKISETIREYIENRYQVNALEQTTDEIMMGLRFHSINADLLSKLNQILTLADLVKFAKENPLPNENDMSIINALEFVANTQIISSENQDVQ